MIDACLRVFQIRVGGSYEVLKLCHKSVSGAELSFVSYSAGFFLFIGIELLPSGGVVTVVAAIVVIWICLSKVGLCE